MILPLFVNMLQDEFVRFDKITVKRSQKINVRQDTARAIMLSYLCAENERWAITLGMSRESVSIKTPGEWRKRNSAAIFWASSGESSAAAAAAFAADPLSFVHPPAAAAAEGAPPGHWSPHPPLSSGSSAFHLHLLRLSSREVLCVASTPRISSSPWRGGFELDRHHHHYHRWAARLWVLQQLLQLQRTLLRVKASSKRWRDVPAALL